MNNCSFTGRLTKNPELKYIAGSGTPALSFTLAVDRNYTNRQGKREADFINMEVLGKGAEKLETMLTKGMLIGVDGSLRINNYTDKEGRANSFTSIRVNNITFLQPKTTAFKPNGEEFNPTFEPTGLDPYGFQAVDDTDLPF